MLQLKGNVVIIDNFYEDPFKIREEALNLEYYEPGYSHGFKDGSGGFPGRMTKNSFYPKDLHKNLSKILSKNLFPRKYSDYGYFRITTTEDEKVKPTLIHTDSALSSFPDNALVGLVYLSLDEHSNNIVGTTLHKHLPTNSELLKDYNHKSQLLATNAFYDNTQWEETHAIQFKFNRLILYPPYNFHKIGKSFGDCKENGRLIQLFSWGQIL